MGAGGAPAWEIELRVTFESLSGQGRTATATLALTGRMDATAVTAMLGVEGAQQGLRGKECRATGEVKFEAAEGREASSSLTLECYIEVSGAEGPPTPAFLRIAYETTNDGPMIPSLPSP
jgi:hypothetical protein